MFQIIIGIIIFLTTTAKVNAVTISNQCATYVRYVSNNQIIDSDYWTCADGAGQNDLYKYFQVYIPQKKTGTAGAIKLQSGDVFQASYQVGTFVARPILSNFTFQSMLTTPLTVGNIIATDTAGANGDPYVLSIPSSEYAKYLSGEYKGFEVSGTGTYYNSHSGPTVDWGVQYQMQSGASGAISGLLESFVAVIFKVIPIAIAIVGGMVVSLFGIKWLFRLVRGKTFKGKGKRKR